MSETFRVEARRGLPYTADEITRQGVTITNHNAHPIDVTIERAVEPVVFRAPLLWHGDGVDSFCLERNRVSQELKGKGFTLGQEVEVTIRPRP